MPDEPRYGRRRSGEPRDPWHNSADAEALGYSSTWKFRLAEGRRNRPLATAREIAGHGGNRYAVTLIDKQGRLVTVPDLDYRSAKRAGRIAQQQGRVARGEADGAEYERRAKRMAPIAGEEPAKDVDVLEAGLFSAEPDDWVFES